MWKLAPAVLGITLIAIVALSSSQPWSASAGVPTLPPAGTDEFDINGEVDIDLGLCCGTAETVELTGTMAIERGAPSKGVIPIEIVQLQLTGDSSLLGGDTPVKVSHNPNAPPSTGLFDAGAGFPGEASFDLQFLDVQIGPFAHFLLQPVQMSGSIFGIPPYGDKFSSAPKDNPIQDVKVQGEEGVRGFMTDLNIDIKPPEKKYTIIAMKLDQDGAPVEDWEINLLDGDCDDPTADVIDSDLTDDDGIATFNAVQPGIYSVEEKSEPGWNPITDPCVDVAFGVAGDPAGAAFEPCPNDPSTCDSFNSAGLVNIRPAGSDDLIGVSLSGPTVIKRGPVIEGTLDRVETEIIQLDLVGSSPTLGDVTVRQSPTTPTTGEIVEQVNQHPGELDLPPFVETGSEANSSFDVFFEVEVEEIGATLHNEEPLHLECKIEEIPPELCFYEPPVPEPIPLLDPDGVELATIEHALHIPLPPKTDFIVFRNEEKEKKYAISALKLDENGDPVPGWQMNLYAGKCDSSFTLVEFQDTDQDGFAHFVDLQPGQYFVEEKDELGWNPISETCIDINVPAAVGGSPAGVLPECPNNDPDTCDAFDSGGLVHVRAAGDDELHSVTLNGPTLIKRADVAGGALDSVQTEIIQLDLVGQSPTLDDVVVRQSQDLDSTGKITEQENDIQGVLEMPADSVFDVFFEVDVFDMTLHNEEPLELECKIEDIPPELCFYEPPIPDPIPLLNDEGVTIAFIEHALHIPLPPNDQLVVFRNERKDGETATPVPDSTATPTPEGPTVTSTPITDTPTPAFTATKTPQPQRTRHATLRCVRDAPGTKVTGTATATEKKEDQPDNLRLTLNCDSNTNPVVRASYTISAGATKNIQLNVTVAGRSNSCPHPGFGATEDVSVSCTASPEGLELIESETPALADGDVDKNGSTNSIDAALTLQFTAGLLEAINFTSDVNEDGMSTSVDAALILQFTAALLDELPV